jgi:hypothetical protein
LTEHSKKPGQRVNRKHWLYWNLILRIPHKAHAGPQSARCIHNQVEKSARCFGAGSAPVPIAEQRGEAPQFEAVMAAGCRFRSPTASV